MTEFWLNFDCASKRTKNPGKIELKWISKLTMISRNLLIFIFLCWSCHLKEWHIFTYILTFCTHHHTQMLVNLLAEQNAKLQVFRIKLTDGPKQKKAFMTTFSVLKVTFCCIPRKCWKPILSFPRNLTNVSAENCQKIHC